MELFWKERVKMPAEVFINYPKPSLQDAHEWLKKRLCETRNLDEYRDVSDLIKDVEVELCWRKRG